MKEVGDIHGVDWPIDRLIDEVRLDLPRLPENSTRKMLLI